ncbi:ABC-2 type transport system ATP-binding protein [Micrococcales bacterium KH10]|nr:ABC-2 type transport system ATP-binding protein [Micrococcales bacterium KH10]
MTIQVREISRRFGNLKALDDVSFDIRPGRLTGFVGGNGAGKTTAMRIILGVLTADSGSVLQDGRELTGSDRKRFGYMPEERGLYPKMKVREQLVYLARLHGLSSVESQQRADSLLERLELAHRGNDLVESLSLGNQQRAQIAAALVHDPAALVLDEPFSGLDPLAVDVVLAVLTEAADNGVPVLLSSHQLDVVERLCDDLVIISQGQIRAAGARDDLRAQHSPARYRIETDTDLSWLTTTPGLHDISIEAGAATFECRDRALVQQVVKSVAERGDLHAFAPERRTLAEIFREVVADSAQQEES